MTQEANILIYPLSVQVLNPGRRGRLCNVDLFRCSPLSLWLFSIVRGCVSAGVFLRRRFLLSSGLGLASSAHCGEGSRLDLLLNSKCPLLRLITAPAPASVVTGSGLESVREWIS